MSVIETVLVFGGIPLLALIALAVMIFGSAEMRAGRDRYRPGRPWNHEPVWYLPQVVSDPDAVPSARLAIESGDSKRTTHAVGGATGEW